MSFKIGNKLRQGLKPVNAWKKGNIPWNKKDIKIFCQYCEKEIWPRDRLTIKFCSRRCYCQSLKGKRKSFKTEFKKGSIPWNKNKKGRNSHSWKGGISFEPYSWEFNRDLKNKIKERDDFTCQKCGKLEKEQKLGLTIHHIDYNKKNCSPNNLITLCKKCNSLANWNRKKWKNYYQNIMKENIMFAAEAVEAAQV